MPKKEKANTFISLFSGCGGMDLGFIQSGFICLGAYDHNPIALRTHQSNLDAPINERDLSIEVSKDIFPCADLVIAGPPCQGFSTIGKRDFNDPRNSLVLTTGLLALQMRPKVIIVENVPGILAGHHKIYWEELQKSFRAKGYQTAQICNNASDHGVAQIRKRVLLLAWRTGKNVRIELPKKNPVSLREAISNINGARNNNIKFLDPMSEAARIAQFIKPSQKLCNVRGGKRSVHTWDIPSVYGKTTKNERILLEALMCLRRRECSVNCVNGHLLKRKSFFIFNGKLIHGCRPVSDRHCPLFRDV